MVDGWVGMNQAKRTSLLPYTDQTEAAKYDRFILASTAERFFFSCMNKRNALLTFLVLKSAANRQGKSL
jgi:hypothetical protein